MIKHPVDIDLMIMGMITRIKPIKIYNKIPLQIIGDSPFTRAVKKRCDLWGVPAEFNDHIDQDVPVLVDREVSDIQCVYEHQDIDDHGLFLQLSACGEAVAHLLDGFEVGYGDDVVMVGNGHAVKGVADHLLKRGCSVTVVNSRTKNVSSKTLHADVIVMSAPKIDTKIFTTGKLVIDISGQLPNTFARNYVSASKVGKLTCALLADRASYWGV